MLDSASLSAATEGSDVLYAVVGLPYATKVWQRDWPPAMRNLISTAEANGCKLVFLDNVYAYGLVAVAMTEATPYNPCSHKGEVRARIATELTDAMSGRIVATIGRSADFYGPEAVLSILGERFFKVRSARARLNGCAPAGLFTPLTTCWTTPVLSSLWARSRPPPSRSDTLPDNEAVRCFDKLFALFSELLGKLS